MCPPLPVSVPLDIDAQSSDEEVILFLGRFKVGDQVPVNWITEVNPFSIDPRNSPEGIWFLCTSKDSQSVNEGDIIKVTNGYWRSTDDHRILTTIPSIGRKTTREFYVGQAPFGDRTGWRMLEYWAEQTSAKVNNKFQLLVLQNNSSLCRFFLENDERPHNGEQYETVISGDADGEYIEPLLLGLLAQEETNFSIRDAADKSQVIGDGVEGQLESSNRPFEALEVNNSIERMQAGYDFSKEDYLELKDLYDPESSSSSSDNSSLMSMNSDDCFDAEALLRDIENEGILNIEEHVECRLSTMTSVRPNQVAVRLPTQAFSNNDNLVVSDTRPARPTPAVNPVATSSIVKPESDGGASTSGSSQGSRRSRSRSRSFEGSSPQFSGYKAARRMAKLGKRYFCFNSF